MVHRICRVSIENIIIFKEEIFMEEFNNEEMLETEGGLCAKGACFTSDVYPRIMITGSQRAVVIFGPWAKIENVKIVRIYFANGSFSPNKYINAGVTTKYDISGLNGSIFCKLNNNRLQVIIKCLDWISSIKISYQLQAVYMESKMNLTINF